MGSRGCLIWSTEAAALHRGLGGAVRLALGGTPSPRTLEGTATLRVLRAGKQVPRHFREWLVHRLHSLTRKQGNYKSDV